MRSLRKWPDRKQAFQAAINAPPGCEPELQVRFFYTPGLDALV